MYDFSSIYCATSVEDAIDALCKDEHAVIISGGSDVLIKIREGRLSNCSLISIHDIASLKGVSIETDGTIVIGAGTVFSDITEAPLIKKHLWMLGEAVDQVGGPQIRNIGTIGGNVCNGVTSADSASTLLTMNAVLALESKEGTRYVPISEFYTGPGKTVRRHDELLTQIRIAKKEYEGFEGKYIKYGKRNAMEIATLGCAAYVKLAAENITAQECTVDEEKADIRISELRLGFGVAAPTPIRCPNAENLAAGQIITDDLLEKIADCAVTEVHPRTSWRASKEFRLQLIHELTKRAIKEAVRRGIKAVAERKEAGADRKEAGADRKEAGLSSQARQLRTGGEGDVETDHTNC